jgi:SAM-dependent methyltransferase
MPRHSRPGYQRADSARAGTACPACGVRAGKEIARYLDFPTFLFPMPRTQARKVARRDLVLHGCERCGHLYQPRVDAALLDVIYQEHYSNYPYDSAEAMQGPYREPFNRMFESVMHTRAFPGSRRLLEIGCSRPENLQVFVDQGFDCVGVDPSPLAAQTRENSRISIFRGYYETTTLPGPFQVIVSRFNLEHVVGPGRMLAKMRKELAPGGLVVVQVPNVQYYLSKRQPVFVAHEHIQYFRVESLRRLFARFEMWPIAEHHFGQPSIIACFTNNRSRAKAGVAKSTSFHAYSAEIARRREKLQAYLVEPRRVVLYGCGLALFSALSAMPVQALDQLAVVDDNPRYEGTFVPSYDIPVRQADSRVFDDRDIVLLTLNPLYHDQVLSRLRATGRRLRVVCLREDGIHELRLPGSGRAASAEPARRGRGRTVRS